MFADRQAVAAFLRDHWQKEPLLLRGALPGFSDPITPEELAGLACEEEVESRLVRHDDGWQLRHGPFRESDFLSLPGRDWTVLVQGVDRWFTRVKALQETVNFIPRWRVDDVMVSYAVENGTVGPHFDYYDVFIIQGLGTRRWQIGQHCDSSSELITYSGLKILENFEVKKEWELQCGDVLYIPPGVAHCGTARGPSLNYSIGFRAPSLEEILIGFTDELCASLSEDIRYRDPEPEPVGLAGEITPATLDSLLEMVRQAVSDRKTLGLWFGKKMTEPAGGGTLPESDLDTQHLAWLVKGGALLVKNLGSRFCYLAEDHELFLFADGQCFCLTPGSLQWRLVRLLNETGAETPLELHDFLENGQSLAVLAGLCNLGALVILDEEE